MPKTTDRADVEEWLDAMNLATTPTKDARHLRAVGEALTALEQAEIRLKQAIVDARDAGDSWTAIGTMLGTSRQAAHRKFGSFLPTSAAGSVPDPVNNRPAVTVGVGVGDDRTVWSTPEEEAVAEHQDIEEGRATEPP